MDGHRCLSLLRSLALGVPLVLAQVGCQSAPPSGEAGQGLARRDDPIRIANSLSTKALTLNAISTNPLANALLTSGGLKDAFEPSGGNSYLREQLLDTDAQHFMEYLVGCALEQGQDIEWPEPITGNVSVWRGQIGLCPEWRDEAPTEECQRRISACILARNNAFGKRVELSLRGEDWTRGVAFGLEPKSRTVTHDPSSTQLIPSFAACTTAQSTVSRDCGWSADYIGQCQPGQAVRLGAGGPPPDQCGSGPLGSFSGARMVLRVCEGIVGCDSGGPRFLTQSQGSCGTIAPAVTFACPASGYFNVMTAPYNSWESGTAYVQAQTGTPANTRYAASETEAFRIREGAFYGTLFDPDALGADVYVEGGEVHGKEQVIKGAAYRKMFACHDPGWNQGLAYATHRACALPNSGEDCAAIVTGACINRQDPSFPASKCRTEDGPLLVGDGDFERCQDSGGAHWMEPITVFLNAPCDLLPADLHHLCARNDTPPSR